MNPSEGFGFEGAAGGCSRVGMNKSLCTLLDDRKPGLGSTYQNGVGPGPRKLAQFQECLRLSGVTGLDSQSGDEATVYVKFFDPAGSWTWYITEWDGADLAFGLVCGDFAEVGYINIRELASLRGALNIGVELDMHFVPAPLSTVRPRPSFHA